MKKGANGKTEYETSSVKTSGVMSDLVRVEPNVFFRWS